MSVKQFSVVLSFLMGLSILVGYLLYRDATRVIYIPLTGSEVSNIVEQQFDSYEDSQKEILIQTFKESQIPLQEDAIIKAIETGFNID